MTFVEQLDEYRGHNGAIGFAFTYDPKDGSGQRTSALYAMSYPHALLLAERMCRDFGMKLIRLE